MTCPYESFRTSNSCRDQHWQTGRIGHTKVGARLDQISYIRGTAWVDRALVQHMKLECHELVSNFALNHNLRHYIAGKKAAAEKAAAEAAEKVAEAEAGSR